YRFVMPETTVLASICLLDTVLTVGLIGVGAAYEANPVFRAALAYGIGGFVLVKLATFMVPLLILEIIRDLCPRFIQASLRVGIIGYLAVYFFGSLLVNGKLPFYTPSGSPTKAACSSCNRPGLSF
ncbi:MAG: DUF5658 family protein, partial [Fimbriimonas sp.]